jgi:hypothetical protein
MPSLTWRLWGGLGLLIIGRLGTPASLHGQDLDPTAIRVTLDSALQLAQRAAASAFPELSKYVLYSVTPRVLKADPRSLHWQVLWQERAFPHHRWLVLRVSMRDGYTTTEREPAAGAPPSPESAPTRRR